MSFAGWTRTTLFGLGDRDMAAVTRHFADAAPNVRARLDGVCDAFKAGYNAALAADGVDDLLPVLDALEADWRGWAYEGAGMGMGIRVLTTPGSELYAEYLRKADPHHYLIQVGAGWALGKVPVRRSVLWAQAGTNFHWLAWDGWGFHDAIFKTEATLVRYAGRPEDEVEAASYDQGVGRALWFVEAADPARVARRIATFPASRQADLWGGIGLAANYACGVDEETLAALMAEAKVHARSVGVGASLAVCARARAGNLTDGAARACRVLTGLDADDANRAVLAIMDGLPDGVGKYPATRRALLDRVRLAA